MKKQILFMALLLASANAFAKDIKTLRVTTLPQMHCENCEKKIKGNLRFERGVKRIDTNIPEQTVTITYDADKTTPQKLIEAFGKFDYQARELKEGEKAEKTEQGE